MFIENLFLETVWQKKYKPTQQINRCAAKKNIHQLYWFSPHLLWENYIPGLFEECFLNFFLKILTSFFLAWIVSPNFESIWKYVYILRYEHMPFQRLVFHKTNIARFLWRWYSHVFWKKEWENFYASPTFFDNFWRIWGHHKLANVVSNWSYLCLNFHYRENLQ